MKALFLILLSASALFAAYAVPVLDMTTTPPPTSVEESPQLVVIATPPKIELPPLPSAPPKLEPPPKPIKVEAAAAAAIPPPPLPIIDNIELDDLVDRDDDNDDNNGDGSVYSDSDDDNNDKKDNDNDGDVESDAPKAKQQKILKFVVQNTTTAKRTKLEAKNMICSIDGDHLVCSSVDLDKVAFEPTECTVAADNNNLTICRRSLAAYSAHSTD